MINAVELNEPPVLTPRQQQECNLYRQAQGTFAPARPGTFFAEERARMVEKFIRKGLEAYDAAHAAAAAQPAQRLILD